MLQALVEVLGPIRGQVDHQHQKLPGVVEEGVGYREEEVASVATVAKGKLGPRQELCGMQIRWRTFATTTTCRKVLAAGHVVHGALLQVRLLLSMLLLVLVAAMLVVEKQVRPRQWRGERRCQERRCQGVQPLVLVALLLVVRLAVCALHR